MKDNQPVIVERTYNVPVEKVWTALTDKDEMKKWYFDLKEFRAEVGFEFTFMGGKPGKKQYLHLCKITEVIKNKKLTYSWKYDGYEGISYVTFDLSPDEQGDKNKTKLKLTHIGLESFPASNPDLDRKNFVEGWNSILTSSLPDYLEKQTSNV